MNSLHVMPGFYCNLECDHCVSESGPSATLRLDKDELEEIQNFVRTRPLDLIYFSGGEPSFYTTLINSILRAIKAPEQTKVSITTNGWYGESYEKTSKVLGRFHQLDEIQLSFDRFHGSVSDEAMQKIEYINNYSKERGIFFSISYCITSPLDLINVKSIKMQFPDVSFHYQHVEAAGRARETQTAYAYPKFDASVFDKRCPNLGVVNYIAGKGFSTCCSNLVFNGKSDLVCRKQIDDYLGSSFHRELSSSTLGDMARKRGKTLTNLSPKLSSVCSFCEYIHA